VVNFSDTLKEDNMSYRTVMAYLISTSAVDAQITLIEKKEANIQEQLHKLHELFYDQEKDSVEKYIDLTKDIKNDKISLDNFTPSDKVKLEKEFNITKADKDHHNRFNILYIVPLPTKRQQDADLPIRDYYDVEKNHFRTNVSDVALAEEFALVKNPKAKTNVYSGPKWIGRDDKMEVPGNKIGFLNQATKTIEICDIIDVHKFGRRIKRQEWKEKGNRTKNILFLSPVRKKMKLTRFKQLVMKTQKKKQLDIKKLKYLDRFELGRRI
jgi:hypothetical protein